MDAEKYRTLLEYKKNNEYPTGFSKQDKTVLRNHAKKFEFDPKSDSLFYLSKQRDGTTLKRLVVQEDEKARVFAECHSANFSGHAGRDNTLQKIKQRYYWPNYYTDTAEMVRYF